MKPQRSKGQPGAPLKSPAALLEPWSDENLLRAIVDTTPECIKLLGPDGNLLHMNPAGLAMIEADSLEHVVGQCIYPHIEEAYRARYQQLIESAFQGESASLEFELVGRKGTQRWLETHTLPLRDAGSRV